MSNVLRSLKKLAVHTLMDKYREFCVREAQYHIDRARELLSDGLRDPKKYYDEAQEFYKVMAKMFPLMILLQQCNEPQLPDQEMEESLSDTLSSTRSDSDSFEPVTPSDR
jgi:hypothetical protein